MRGKTIAKIVGTLLVVGAVYCYFKDDVAQFWNGLHVKLAEYPTPKNTRLLDQNVSDEKIGWYYHADQGTRTFSIPYEWFMALEQPSLLSAFGATSLFSDSAYLDRYGFIPDPIDKKALPIGFARSFGEAMLDSTGEPWRNPSNKTDMHGIGLTCAACHTGRFTYKDTAVIINGGPALTDLLKLKQGIGVALFETRFLPGRFNRFAERILGADSTVDERATLKFQIDQVLKVYNDTLALEKRVSSRSIEEGYGRLDALNRIGNQVFSIDLKNPDNYAGSSAPVHYPRIWNTPWFDWVQYNGSIMQPMVRNAGESLGVSSELNLTDPSKGLYKSSVNVASLYAMEEMIKGNNPPNAKDGFSGLKSPKWPGDILPPVDTNLAAQGAKLYEAHCQGCHRPPVTSEALYDFNNKKWWRTNQNGEHVMVMENIPIEHIGTDPAQAGDMAARTVAVPANLGIDKTGFAFALGEVVEKTVNYIYDRPQPPLDANGKPKPPLSEAERRRLNGYMPNELQGDLAYKVRPLNGVWATPPYLHNASVPAVDALLSPIEDRPKKFYLGNREYDPVNLGYKTDYLKNGFEFDTSIRGNSNEGHQFRAGYDENKPVRGVIGPALSPDDRKALIEYLKTL
jgi:mono/diheme cytochrome c family protein